jgi:hypothetical protein
LEARGANLLVRCHVPVTLSLGEAMLTGVWALKRYGPNLDLKARRTRVMLALMGLVEFAHHYHLFVAPLW